MKIEMPTINLNLTELSGADMAIARACLNGDKLRATKPVGERDTVGEAQYVWRMVAFMVSPHSQHHCMPVMAQFYTPSDLWSNIGSYIFKLKDGRRVRAWGMANDEGVIKPITQARKDEIVRERSELRNKRLKELNLIVDAMVDTVPNTKWYGVRRWSNIL